MKTEASSEHTMQEVGGVTTHRGGSLFLRTCFCRLEGGAVEWRAGLSRIRVRL